MGGWEHPDAVCGPSRTKMLEYVREELADLRNQLEGFQAHPARDGKWRPYIEHLEKRIKECEREERRCLRGMGDSK